MVNCLVTSLWLLGLVGAITAARIVKVDQLLAVLAEGQGIEVNGVELDVSPYQRDDLDFDLDISDLLQGCNKGKCEFCAKKVVKACIVATLLSSGVGFDITLTINGHTVFNKVVKVNDPPPFCVKKLGPISYLCLTVYEVNLKELSACTKLSFTIKIRFMNKNVSFKIGCFKIPTVDNVQIVGGAVSVEDIFVEAASSDKDGENMALLYKSAGSV